MACCLSMGTMACYRGPSASLSLLTGSRTRTSVSLNVKSKSPTSLLHSAFTPSSSLSSSSGSSFSGSSLGLELNSSTGMVGSKRRGLVVRASKYTLCQTKRNRSRKSLARTHGFRKRMSTTRGRAVIKRRRAKGRWNLCTKSNPNSGKRA
ncbi:50S ribosomal protein L34, chloroplastic [Sesamum alatum]|uniref:Large ribosomal subunit protein bL34c n=1 Tax=Sesamum alatum TaxID=300844 RepID=A0AAE1Y0C0_9LAMI|nr:50S ribosomal protein L34, chloroplastic [Sesamum alatum]